MGSGWRIYASIFDVVVGSTFFFFAGRHRLSDAVSFGGPLRELRPSVCARESLGHLWHPADRATAWNAGRRHAAQDARHRHHDGVSTTTAEQRRESALGARGHVFRPPEGNPVCVCVCVYGRKERKALSCHSAVGWDGRTSSASRVQADVSLLSPKQKRNLNEEEEKKDPRRCFLCAPRASFGVCVCVCVGGESPKKAKPKNERTKTTRNDEGRGDVIEGGRLADWSPLVGGAGAGRGPGRGPSRCLQCGYSQRVDPSRTVGILFRIQCRRPHGPRPQLVSFFSFFCPFFWFFCRVYRPFACSGASTWKQRSVLLAPPQIESTAVFVSFFFCCQCLFTRPISSLVSRALSKVIWFFFCIFLFIFFLRPSSLLSMRTSGCSSMGRSF